MNKLNNDERQSPRVKVGLTLLGVICSAGLALSSQAKDGATSGGLEHLTTPEQVYTASCAACHGQDGKGMPPEMLGQDTVVPDFSYCFFATREPDPDWFAVAHQGGPVRGFDYRMPSFGKALSAEQIEMAVQHIRTFCAGKNWPRGNLNNPRAMFTEKAFVEDEAVLTLGSSVEEPYEMLAELTYETRFGKASQLEVIIPLAINKLVPSDEDPQTGWVGGLADMALGVKQVFVSSLVTGTILSGMAEVILPTGDEDDGLSKGVVVAEPGLTLGQSLGPAGFLHIQLGAEIPVEKDPESEGFWRAAYGYTITEGPFGRAWTPMVEVLGWMDLKKGAETHWDLAPQFQVSLNTRQHVALCLAARIPVEPGNDRPIGVFAYLLWEWFDGGLGEGW